MPHIPLVFIIAGEPSGDQLGADLMASLKKLKDVHFTGIGGPAMTAQGLKSLFPMEELSIMGVGGIVRQLPHLLRRLSDTVKTIQNLRPDVVVTIDAPEFSFRVLKRLHASPARPRLIHYVAPTVWAWRPGRAHKISRFVDLLLCLYPFEPPYFEKHGLKTIFVGHPVVREPKYPSPAHRLTRWSTSPTRGEVILNVKNPSPLVGEGVPQGRVRDGELRHPNLLCVLPGSRRSEIETLMPIFKETIALVKKEIPDLRVILPTLPSMKNLLKQQTQDWPVPLQIVVGEAARNEAFQHASTALAASGTVALQLAAAGLPFVIAYKVSKVNEWIARTLLKTPWACMINILLAFHTVGPGFVLNRKAKERVREPWIPEFLQNDCTPENLKAALMKLLKDPETRAHQEHAMRQAIALLQAPSHIAAKNVLEEIEQQGKKPPC